MALPWSGRAQHIELKTCELVCQFKLHKSFRTNESLRFFCRYAKNKLACIVCICVVKRFLGFRCQYFVLWCTRSVVAVPYIVTILNCINEHGRIKKSWIFYRISIEFKHCCCCLHCFSVADNLLQAAAAWLLRGGDHDGSGFDWIAVSDNTNYWQWAIDQYNCWI